MLLGVLTATSCRAGDSLLVSRGWSPVKAGQRPPGVARSAPLAQSLAPEAGEPLGNGLAPDESVGLSAALPSHSPDVLSEYATCVGSPLTCVGTPLHSEAGTWLTGTLSPLEGMQSFDNPWFDLGSGLDPA